MFMAKYIAGSKGDLAIVDDEDYPKLKMYNWSTTHYGHLCRGKRIGKKTINILLHRYILGNIPDDLEVDHINGNPLDNRKENLRLCTHQQNMCNKSRHKNCRSGYKGVTWDSWAKKWRATITFMGIIHKKHFKSDEDAARWYNKMAKKYHKEFARLNEI